MPVLEAASAAVFSSSQVCGSVLHDVLVVVEDAQVGAPPPGVDMAVGSGDAFADEGEEVVELFLGEELVERLQHAVLDEERELEAVDRHAVGGAAGAGLFEQAGMLGADVLAEILEIDLPVGMRRGPLLPGGGVFRADLLVRVVAGRLVGVHPHGQRVRRVGLADMVRGHETLREGAGGHAREHGRGEESELYRSEHLEVVLPFAAACFLGVPKPRARRVAQRSLSRPRRSMRKKIRSATRNRPAPAGSPAGGFAS